MRVCLALERIPSRIAPPTLVQSKPPNAFLHESQLGYFSKPKLANPEFSVTFFRPAPAPWRGGLGRGDFGACRRFINRPPNCVHDRVSVFIQLLIPKANNAVAARGEPVGAPLVMLDRFRFQMLPAIELDDEFVREAHEINHVRTATIRNGWCPRLTTKFPTAELLSAKEMP